MFFSVIFVIEYFTTVRFVKNFFVIVVVDKNVCTRTCNDTDRSDTRKRCYSLYVHFV